MKKRARTCLIVAPALLAGAVLSQNFTYVGAGKCRVCHRTEKQGRQYSKWEESRHSRSLTTLNSADVAARAAKAGVKNPAENPGCLRCHAPLAVKAPELKAEVALDNINFVSNEHLVASLSNTSATPEQSAAAVLINEVARLRALKAAFLILAVIALLAIFPARGLPHYDPGEVPSEEEDRSKRGKKQAAPAA